MLVFWNKNEAFPSLGIGHFIWFPKNETAAREKFGGDSFPELVKLMMEKGIALPKVVTKTLPELHCPWKNRGEFLADGARDAEELRELLHETKHVQLQLIIRRFKRALPKLLDRPSKAESEIIKARIDRIVASRASYFPLIDYVNFKGEGLSDAEGGWGLLQVLKAMNDDSADASAEFGAAAIRVLTKRVNNDPKDAVHLPGWSNRMRQYGQFVLPSR
jgi:hypothetical protein